MKTFAFQVIIETDQFEDGKEAYHAYCPALQGCRTWGHTYDEALSNIKEVVELCVAGMMESGGWQRQVPSAFVKPSINSAILLTNSRIPLL